MFSKSIVMADTKNSKQNMIGEPLKVLFYNKTWTNGW